MKPTRPHPNEIARSHGITLTAKGDQWIAQKGPVKQVAFTKRKALSALLSRLHCLQTAPNIKNRAMIDDTIEVIPSFSALVHKVEQ